MSRTINSVAVLGGGTMGTGIAGACAQAGHRVLLLDVDRAAAEKALDRILNGRPPSLEDPEKASLITLGSFDDDLGQIAYYDWICEAIVEDVDAKRALFERFEPLRRDGSVVSTNTSGIPLHSITQGMPERLRRDIAVTHFFNPVQVMKLMELVPDSDTTVDVIDAFTDFCGGTLGKGVVHAKDTVNFIGNRIGCFLLLSGLHKAKAALADGLSMEDIDALMNGPVGLPKTGLYGLFDLIGLDIMALVGKNLAVNLPGSDAGHAFTSLPATEQAMHDSGQLGRKTGSGFYKMIKHDDGSRSKEIYDLTNGQWRDAMDVELAGTHQDAASLIFGDDAQARFTWDLMGGTLCYAAGLVPEISNDVVNIDNAMRWGFAWRKGPFQFLDALGPARVIAKLEGDGQPLPAMLQVLKDSGGDNFYRADGAEFLGLDGAYHPML
ncbi:MAG: 3-hydroxyacyl-CoA dehydrogenase family protein [Pseudomonadota bacterium]|nr:3-hydroxyacyl-CoA dehydrogenase family protein [Pseudomonadota bacterium]